MNSVNHFEIPADDMQRANTFYSTVFGWQAMPFTDDTTMVATTKSDENGMAQTPGAINGDISKRDDNLKHPAIMITVDSLDEHMQKIKDNGGKVLAEPVEVPEMGKFVYVADTEGNTIGIWENS